MPIWDEAVKNAIRRHVAETGSPLFTRKALIASEIGAIAAETRTTGATPTQTLGRELQQLRDAGLVEFLERGTYRWLGAMPDPAPVIPSRGIMVLAEPASRGDLPERYYRFSPQCLRTAMRTADQWIIFQEAEKGGRGRYRAAARVDRIDPKPDTDGMCRAVLAEGSYLEFGVPVPFIVDGMLVERGLLDPDGSLNAHRASQAVRIVAEPDFDRIVELGLVSEEELLPRTEAEEDLPVVQRVAEERASWEGQVDRATMLVNRKVRDRQFRKRVLDAYGSRCALTGMKLLNGGGRAETEAAHIQSVEAGGPDALDNGIALSGTMHWMFDRGLISLSDAGDILLSRAINDRDSVERLVFADRKARLPAAAADRPHPRYLHWHRTHCFHD
jgi:putative restriction endonuclease